MTLILNNHDVEKVLTMADTIAGLDIGQTVAVKDRAVEAAERRERRHRRARHLAARVLEVRDLPLDATPLRALGLGPGADRNQAAAMNEAVAPELGGQLVLAGIGDGMLDQ